MQDGECGEVGRGCGAFGCRAAVRGTRDGEVPSARRWRFSDLTSEEGDDARAAALTDALREQAQDDSGVRVTNTRASLSQMTIMHDCAILRGRSAASRSARRSRPTRRSTAWFAPGARGHEVELHQFTSSDGNEVTAKRVIPAAEAPATRSRGTRARAARGVALVTGGRGPAADSR